MLDYLAGMVLELINPEPIIQVRQAVQILEPRPVVAIAPTPPPQPPPPPLTVEEKVVAHFGADHIMVKIAKCESGFRQFNEDGTVLVNPSPISSASGIFQILYKTHSPDAISRGLDINTIQGNIEYADHLYLTEGTTPWKPSKHCWANMV